MQAVAVLPRRQYILLFEGVSWIQVSNQEFITPSSPRLYYYYARRHDQFI